MKRQIIMDIILMVLIAVLIITIITLIIKFDKDGFECLSNPIIYFENLKNASCDCRERQVWETSFNELNLTLSPS